MKLSVPYNGDDKLLSYSFPDDIGEVYGKYEGDGFGGGRASYVLGQSNKANFIRFLGRLKGLGIPFNYLINSANTAPLEFSARYSRKLHRLLRWLTRLGVDWLTVVSPYLLIWIKQNYPQFKVRLSVYAMVSDISRAQQFADMGADRIVLDTLFVNKSSRLLNQICKKVDCELELIVSNSCLWSCAYSHCHMNLIADNSTGIWRKLFQPPFDFYLLQCSHHKLLSAANFLKTDFVRPEDLGYYEECGINWFKLTERGHPTSLIRRRIDAYSKRSFKGNLLELIQPYDLEEYRPKFSILLFLKTLIFILWPFPSLSRLRLALAYYHYAKARGFLGREAGVPPLAYLDNKKLNSFFRRIEEDGCSTKNCRDCDYCNNWARESLFYNEHRRRVAIEAYEEIRKYFK